MSPRAATWARSRPAVPVVDPTVRRAGVYVRISDDAEGEAKGVARQEEDCRELAKRQGWDVVQVYMENDTSAYKRRKVKLPDGTTALRVIRPAFRQMLHDAQAGVITAIAGYDLDRVARDPRDLEDLIDVVEQQEIPTRAVTGSLDLSNDAGITMARVMVAIANKSSRDTGRRVARAHQQLAQEGKTGGGGIRPYGYAADRMTVDEDEASVIREIARRVLDDGESLRSIAGWLTASGIPTVRGSRAANGTVKGWSTRSVHSVVTKPRVAGLRAYKDEIVGEASWPAILDRETWEQVTMALDERASGGTNRLRYWLSGVMICGACGTKLYGNTSTVPRRDGSEKVGRYWCAPPAGGCGKIAISGRVEQTARDVIVGYLSRPDVLEALQDATSSDATAAVRRELHQDEDQLTELAETYGRRDITMNEYIAARRVIEKRVNGRRRILQATLPRSIVEILNASNAAETFDALDPHQKREVARLVFPGGAYVLPAKVRSYYDPERFVPAYRLDGDPRAALKRVMHDWNGKIQ